jgi:hypothetical protein
MVLKNFFYFETMRLTGMSLKFGVALTALVGVSLSGCSTPGNAPKQKEEKYDFVGGYTGDDRVIVKGDSATLHSDRNAVAEYTKTVDTINAERQKVESDLAGLALCRRTKAREKGVEVEEGPLTVPCMKKVVTDREKAGEDLMQVNGKLVLRKKEDFKSRLDEARACLDQMTSVRDKSRESYMLDECDKVKRQ